MKGYAANDEEHSLFVKVELGRTKPDFVVVVAWNAVVVVATSTIDEIIFKAIIVTKLVVVFIILQSIA